MDPVPGYEMASWERGYGDFRVEPGSARRCGGSPGSRGPRSCSADVLWHDGSPVGAVASAGAGAQVERARALGFEPKFGSELEFFLFKETYAEAHEKHYRGADALGAVHPRLPRARDELRRAADPPDPQRHAGRRDQGRVVEGRGVGRAARDQLPLRARAGDGGQPRRLQERRQGDRAPERLLDHVHGEARPRVGRFVMPRPLRACGGAARTRSPGRARRSERSSPGGSPGHASWRCSSRRTSTRTSATRPGAGRRRRSPGGTTTARAASASSGTARARASRRGSRAPTSTRTSRSPRCWPRGCTGSRRDSSRRRCSRETRTSRTSQRFPSTLREAITELESGTIARAGIRRRGGRPLPELRADRAAVVRPGRHLLRARAPLRARMRPVVGITRYVEPAKWGHGTCRPR